jgi:hypothetical protein
LRLVTGVSVAQGCLIVGGQVKTKFQILDFSDRSQKKVGGLRFLSLVFVGGLRFLSLVLWDG